MEDSDIIKIYSAANALEAHAMANALDAAGIKAYVAGELSGGYPGTFPSQDPSVWVCKKDQARARELLQQWQNEAKIKPGAAEPEK